ncbi:MAG: hypothetical protein V3U09_06625 [Thermoplasmata archaeon]
MVEDAENVKEILDVVSEKIPKLIENLTDVLYGEKSSAKFGKAVATFYKELVDSGMTKEQAYELTQQYMSSLNLAGLIGDAVGGGGKGHKIMIKTGSGDNDIGKEIEERVKEKIRKKFEDEE